MPPLPIAWELLPLADKTLVAISGGADSVALLWALRERDIVAGHVNHGLRGADSDADEAFVADLCREWRVPLRAVRVVPGPNAHEAALRDARYAALETMARECGCARLATAHTASDNLETLLLFWLRGATVAGFGGIAPQREFSPGLMLVRPLLHASREQVREALQQAGVSWREDASNKDVRFQRNRVRHELLPLLRELAGGDLEAPTTRACILRREEDVWLEELARQALGELVTREEDNLLVLDGLAFGALAIPLQRRVLREAARRVKGELRDVNAEAVEGARQHIEARGRRMVWQWAGGLSVEWTGAGSGNRIRVRGVENPSSGD